MTSIRQLAKLAGVSTATVVRALHDNPHVLPETRQRILDLAQLYAYQPRPQATRDEKSAVIGCLVPAVRSLKFSGVLSGVLHQAFTASYQVITLETHYDPTHSRKALDVLIEQRVAGIVIGNGHNYRLPAETLYRLWSHGIHVVGMESMPFDKSVQVDLVQNDYPQLALDMVQYLYHLGHRDIAYMAPISLQDSRLSREAVCFRQAINHFRLSTSAFIDYSGFADEYEAAQYLMHLKPRPTAVILWSDGGAMRLMHAIQSAGWQVPRHISILGCGNLEISQYLTPGLTTFEQSFAELGRKSVELLCTRLTCGRKPNECERETIRIPHTLVERNSCAFIGKRRAATDDIVVRK